MALIFEGHRWEWGCWFWFQWNHETWNCRCEIKLGSYNENCQNYGSIAEVANLWHACSNWHARRFHVARHVLVIFQEIKAESYILKRLQWNLDSEVVKNFNSLHCIDCRTLSIHAKGYHTFSHNTVLCENLRQPNILLCQFTTPVASFMSTGFMLANGTFFTGMTTAKLFSEQYFWMTNRNSTHGKNIAYGSGPDMVKINNFSICISYTNAIE